MSSPVKDPSAPIYITIGDGGNVEGIANRWASFILWFLSPIKIKFGSSNLFLIIVCVQFHWSTAKLFCI